MYPPDWVTEIGKPVPGQAWRRYDVFGDDEALLVTFSYGDVEHAVVVQVDLTGIPVATAAGVAPDPAGLIEAINRNTEEFERQEQISLTEARRRMEDPVARCEEDPELAIDTVIHLPLVRARVRRLPGAEFDPGPQFSAKDRAAAVDDFMKSPLAANAVAADEESTRFWAQVLTGYSSRIDGEAPAQVGPRKLAHLLLGHVATIFDLSPAQRQHLEPAVTAWVRWSAAYRALGEAATAHLLGALPKAFSRFDNVYADPDCAMMRGYTADLVAPDADVSWLLRSTGRRLFALPLPEHHDDHAQAGVASAAERRALVQAEFGGCTPPAGLTSERFVDAAYGVIEEIWQANPVSTFLTATSLSEEGLARHEIIHRLAGHPRADHGRIDHLEGFPDHPMSSKPVRSRIGDSCEEGDAMSYADVNGISLFYEEHGAGQPLILLHGGLGMGEMYAPILPLLAKDRRVITVDLQAHGHTADVDRPLRHETLADDIAGLIGHLGLAQADVMGYSFGGATALRTAIQHPDQVPAPGAGLRGQPTRRLVPGEPGRDGPDGVAARRDAEGLPHVPDLRPGRPPGAGLARAARQDRGPATAGLRLVGGYREDHRAGHAGLRRRRRRAPRAHRGVLRPARRWPARRELGRLGPARGEAGHPARSHPLRPFRLTRPRGRGHPVPGRAVAGAAGAARPVSPRRRRTVTRRGPVPRRPAVVPFIDFPERTRPLPPAT